MRDLLARKFERAALGMGFHPVAQDDVFNADDGLQVPAVLRQERRFRATDYNRIDRRATLAAMSAARKVCPRRAGRRYAATHPQTALTHNEEAPGAATPGASV